MISYIFITFHKTSRNMPSSSTQNQDVNDYLNIGTNSQIHTPKTTQANFSPLISPGPISKSSSLREDSIVNPLKIPHSARNEVHAGEEQCYHCGGFSHWSCNCPKRRNGEPRTAPHWNDWRMVIPGRKLYSTNVLWPNAKAFNQPSSASFVIANSSTGGQVQQGDGKAVDEK